MSRTFRYDKVHPGSAGLLKPAAAAVRLGLYCLRSAHPRAVGKQVTMTLRA